MTREQTIDEAVRRQMERVHPSFNWLAEYLRYPGGPLAQIFYHSVRAEFRRIEAEGR